MQQLNYEQIAAMKGNGSSMRTVLKCFIDMGATVSLLYEDLGAITERYFLVEYEGLTIPLRAYKLNFYSVFNSALAQAITSDKQRSQAILTTWELPTPETVTADDNAATHGLLAVHDRLVVKPRRGAHGDGITINVTDQAALNRAVQHAQLICPDVLVQQQVTGDDHRLLFIDYQFVAAVKRTPASTQGDGIHTVRQLVEASNQQKETLWASIRDGITGADSTPGSISKTPLGEIVAARGETFLDQVPTDGENVQLLDKANVSLGGQTQDITDQVDRQLTDSLTSVLRQIDLPFCGVDVISTDINSTTEEQKSYIIELNAAPGLRLHETPAKGQSRPVCAMMAKALIRHYRSIRA